MNLKYTYSTERTFSFFQLCVEMWNRKVANSSITLFLPLSQDCRLARIWLSIADTHESLSSRLGASKCHVCPVNDTMIKSAFSSSARKQKNKLHVFTGDLDNGLYGSTVKELPQTHKIWLWWKVVMMKTSEKLEMQEWMSGTLRTTTGEMLHVNLSKDERSLSLITCLINVSQATKAF